MKKIAFLLFIPGIMISCGGAEKAHDETVVENTALLENEPVEETVVKKSKSPRLQVSGIVDGVQVDIDYGSPFVNERAIWGDLVAYDKIWRAGANEVTAVTFSEPVIIDKKQIPAGTYALFIIPQEKGNWTMILNEEWSQAEHGVWGSSDYKKEKDVLRKEITPNISEEIAESLTYVINDKGILFSWEKVSLQLEIKAKK